MSKEGKYIYGIIQELDPRRFDFVGVEEAPVYTVNYQKMAAVVSDTGLKEIDPTRKNVLAHTIVQDRLIKDYTVLPMGFGMIANDRIAVDNLLKLNCEGLSKEFERLSGKIEVAVKVFWDKEAMLAQLSGQSETISRARAKLKTASPSQAQDILMEIGQMVERTTKEWKAKYATEAYNQLNGLAVAARTNPEMDVKNILNASFLIQKAKEAEFQKEVYELDTRHRGKLNFKYVGPLPPYNFVQIRMASTDAA